MNQSFYHTYIQYLECIKKVTRRNGWHRAHVGQRVFGIYKGRGRKPGEPIHYLGQHEFIDLRWERLDLLITDLAYGKKEVIKEGFPDMTPAEFVAMYCRINKCNSDALVHRMEFKYIFTAGQYRRPYFLKAELIEVMKPLPLGLF